MRTQEPMKKKDQKMKVWLTNFVILSYLLGITWAIGFLNGLHVAFQYVFVILNCSTGVFILVYSVLSNRRMREQLAMWRNSGSSRVSEFISFVSTIKTAIITETKR
jgi:hypothetical protein